MTSSGDKLAAYIRGILERDGIRPAALESAVGTTSTESVGGAPGTLLPEDINTLRKVELDRPLSPQEQIRLESIVIPNGLRPSFDVVNDSFETLPATWAGVNARKSALEPLLKGIGRLELAGHPLLRFAGTGFVVGRDLLLTNRHVAEFFVDGGHSSTLHFKPGLSSTLDLKQEVGSTASIPVRIMAPVVILDDWDAALLHVEPLPDHVQPLALAQTAPATIDGRLAVVVGYPAMDPGADLIQQIQIFRGVFDKKRLMPGRLMGLTATTSFGRSVNALGHDCTTLGGNSGSAVIDVETGTVMGLHFAGEQFVANFAVPTWELATEPALAAAGAAFL